MTFARPFQLEMSSFIKVTFLVGNALGPGGGGVNPRAQTSQREKTTLHVYAQIHRVVV